MKKDILGIKIDDVNMDEALKVVEKWLNGSRKRYIVTPNPEIVVMAKEDKEFREILNKADMSIPDGVGLKLTGDIECIIPGTDFMEELIKFAQDFGFTTGFLGGRDEVAKRCAECLQKKYPKLKVNFAESGGEVTPEGKLLKSLKMPKTDLLFVGFGPPKQEKWIAKNLQKLNVKVAMGVGGAFDYLSGQVPRAPRWLRDLGFEWLFRLTVQPWRIKRQLTLIRYILLLLK